jgi:hypothetical protein
MMAVEGIGYLAQNLADQLREQALNSQAGADAPANGNADNVAVNEDTFTPSTQNNSAQATAQDAGLFQIGPGALSAVTANFLFELTTPSAASGQIPTQAESATTTGADKARPPAATNANAPANPGQLFAPTPAGQEPAPKATPATNVQEKIQALNADLPALGLSKVEIQEIDTLATQIQNFNPAAYATLVNQFESLAQQGAANAAANASNPVAQKTPASAKVNGGGSQD